MQLSVAPELARLGREHGTPFYAYDWRVMRERVGALEAFDVVRYAQKANSNTHILRLLKETGVVVDAVSLGEMERALKAGFSGGTREPSEIVLTCDVLSEEMLDRAIAEDIPVNCGSEDMLQQVGARKRGHRVWLRVNPGFGHGHSRKTNTGGEWSKHGIWHEELGGAMELVGKYDLHLVGLHMHIGSGTDFEHLKQVCAAMVKEVKRIGHDLEAISGGGGLPIPYRGEEAFDTKALYEHWNQARSEVENILGHSVQLEIEPGRYLAAEAGVLVSEVRAVKSVSGHRFVMVDAGFDNLVRPAMYGSYHRITVHDPEGQPRTEGVGPTVIAGPLCESGDVFTQEEGGVVVPRDLPDARVGDLVLFHDAGAYASSMASNYNSRMLAPEVLLSDDAPRLIRRRQRIDELLALEDV